MTREEIEAVYEQGSEAVIALVERLVQTVEELSSRVKQLEGRLASNSQNSSKPPSSDGFNRKTKSLREKSGRRQGGQKGHQGSTLRFVEEPDKVEVHTPKSCSGCDQKLEEVEVEEVEKRQVFEIPPVKIQVLEHQCQYKRCPRCHLLNKGEFPQGVTKSVQYGNRVRSVAVYLMNYQMLPFARTRELMQDLFGCSISKATLFDSIKHCYEGLAETEQKIKQGLIESQVLNCDETGFYVEGKRQWLHVASNSELTHYQSHSKRGQAATDEIGILPQYKGRAVHDGLSSYQKYLCSHSLCNAHHIRELNFIFEEEKQAWAGALKDLLCEIKKRVEQSKETGEKSLCSQVQSVYVNRYRKILAEGFALNESKSREKKSEKTKERKRGRKAQSKAKNLLDRLQKYEEQVLAFMRDYRVPFDNNQAERDLRMMKVQQKISGCFRSPEGAKYFCRIRGYISTVRKQGKNVLQMIESVFNNSPIQIAYG